MMDWPYLKLQRDPVLAENLIDLANVGLASASLLPFPDRVPPYIMGCSIPFSGFAAKRLCKPTIIAFASSVPVRSRLANGTVYLLAVRADSNKPGRPEWRAVQR